MDTYLETTKDVYREAALTQDYMDELANAFNPAAAMGVMCRNTVSVSWDGKLYDCDFNQMLELELAGDAPKHLRDWDVDKITNRNIILNQHCYSCTATVLRHITPMAAAGLKALASSSM